LFVYGSNFLLCLIIIEIYMEEVRFRKNLYRERRFLRKEILRNKRLKPKVVREKVSIRRGCKNCDNSLVF
jgi:hypothetical protein